MDYKALPESKLGIVCENCGGDDTYLHTQSPIPVLWCAACRHSMSNTKSEIDQFIEDIKALEVDRQEP